LKPAAKGGNAQWTIRKEKIMIAVWNTNAKLFAGRAQSGLYGLHLQRSFLPAYYEEYQKHHNALFETIEKYKNKRMKNIKCLNIDFTAPEPKNLHKTDKGEPQK
jgi:hypothetical protein